MKIHNNPVTAISLSRNGESLGINLLKINIYI